MIENLKRRNHFTSDSDPHFFLRLTDVAVEDLGFDIIENSGGSQEGNSTTGNNTCNAINGFITRWCSMRKKKGADDDKGKKGGTGTGRGRAYLPQRQHEWRKEHRQHGPSSR